MSTSSPSPGGPMPSHEHRSRRGSAERGNSGVPALAPRRIALRSPLVNINSLPMVVDMTDDPRLLGTFTGLYYLASQLASSSGPTLSGLAIDLTGRNYSAIFLLTPAFFGLSLLAMSLVRHGEARRISGMVGPEPGS